MFRLTAELQLVELWRDPNPTRHALMVAGEHLMGDQGLDTPPLHVIAGAAGSGNKYAVQYHFTDREGLIRSILVARAEAIRQRRGELLLDATATGLIDDVGALTEVMYLPLIEQVGSLERSSFARFLILDLTRPWHNKSMEVRQDMQEDRNTQQITGFFERALPHLCREQISWRLRIQTRTILNCLVEHDNLSRTGRIERSESEMIMDALEMATAAMKGAASST